MNLLFRTSVVYKTIKITEYYISQLSHYRVALVFRVINGLFPFITMFVWLSISNGSLRFQGMSKQEIVLYFFGVFIVGQMISSPIVGSLDKDIRTGRLANRLLLPLNPAYYYFGNKLSYAVSGLPYLFIPIAGYIALSSEPLQLASTAILFIPSVSMAIALHFSRQYLIGILSFWTDKSTSIDRLLESIQHLCSGSFIPLMLLSDPVREILMWTPFPYTVYAPVAMLLPGEQIGELYRLLLGQLAWLIIFHVSIRIVWKNGIQRFGDQGS